MKTGHSNGAPLTYSQAVEACGWRHSDDRTGEVLDCLPYYGELLSRDIPPGSFDPVDLEKGQPEKYWGKITNPTVHIGLRQLEKLVNAIIAAHGRPDQIVAIQQKICMPEGMAIIMLAAVKKLCPRRGNPVVNMWCTHRPKPINPVETSASTRAV